jgi:hypothetical protein
MFTLRLIRRPASGPPLLLSGVVLPPLRPLLPSVLRLRPPLLLARLTGIAVPMIYTRNRLRPCRLPTALISAMSCVPLVLPRPALARSLVGHSLIPLVLAHLLARPSWLVQMPIPLRLTPCPSSEMHRALLMSVPPAAVMDPLALLLVDLFLPHPLVLRLPELLTAVLLPVLLLLPTDIAPSLLPLRFALSAMSVPPLLARATLTSSTTTARSPLLPAVVPLVSPPVLLPLHQLRLLLRPLLLSVARTVPRLP